MKVSTPDGHTFSAKTFSFPQSVPQWLLLKPSRRYVSLAVEGARHWGLDQRYISDFLQKVETQGGPLGAFGLYTEPRPHLLDRPNPTYRFGDTFDELLSPFRPIGSDTPLRAFKDSEEKATDNDIRLVDVSEQAPNRKLLYYIPGIDGTGKGILSQVDELERDGVYNLKSIVLPFDYRESMQVMMTTIMKRIAEDSRGRPVGIVGESMGGMLCLQLALENVRRKEENSELPILDIDFIVIMNAGTSYTRSNPKALWDFLLGLNLSDEVYAPLLAPILLPFLLDIDSTRDSFYIELFPRLRKLLFSLRDLHSTLPQDTLRHRIGLLSENVVEFADLSKLSGKHGPRLLAQISSVNDALLPSLAESYRLRRAIPDIVTMVLPFGGHALILDRNFSLGSYLAPIASGAVQRAVARGKGLLTPPTKQMSAAVLRRREAMRRKFVREGTSNGADSKSLADIERLRAFLGESLRQSSPVFIGEENIPLRESSNRPVLFVGNHTLLGWLDAANPILRMLTTRDVLIHSLAHPTLFRKGDIVFPGTTTVKMDEAREFGVTTVSPNALLDQLANGRWCLLFPGGAVEALKQPGDKKYGVRWPEEPEFVRACALFGATIIPMSTVGPEDTVRIVGDSKAMATVLETIFRVTGQKVDPEMARDDAKKWKEPGDLVIPPLIVPDGSDRFYYRFGKPVEVGEECLHDKKKAKVVFDELSSSVSEGVDMLLKRREADRYRTEESRKEFARKYGDTASPPAGMGWCWMRGDDSYLDDDAQPPLN